MKDMILCQSKSTNIINPEGWGSCQVKMQIFEKHSNPIELSSSDCHGMIFNLCTRTSNNRLLLPRP
jgi:hypothetical protein